MLSLSPQTNNGIKTEPFSPSASAGTPVTLAAAPTSNIKAEAFLSTASAPNNIQPSTTNSVMSQPPAPNINGTARVVPNAPVPNALAPMATPIAAAPTTTIPATAPQTQMLPQMEAKPVLPQQQPPATTTNTALMGKTPIVKNVPMASGAVGTAPGTIRNGNGGGQLLQFPWKLHEMLHLAEKNGKTDIISWLPGGNGFKVHNKEKFCAEIMPGYFASQKYKTFQRSLNLWGFESVAKGPDRGACYHQYFVKGHPELCHNMTRVKIKGQSNPRTPAAAAAAAAAAAKRAAMGAAMTAAMTANQQQVQTQQGLVAQQQQVVAQQQAQPLNLFAMNHFIPGANMAMPHLGMAAAGNQVPNANVMAAAAANPYALAMNNFATMNALQQINPALAAAAMQNPAMNAMIAAQVMAAAANNPAAQQARAMAAAQQQQQMAPVAAQQRPGAPGPVATAPVNATFAPGVAVQQQQQQQLQMQQQQQQQLQMQLQQQQQQQQQMGCAPATPAPAPVKTNPGLSMQMNNPGAPGPAMNAPQAANGNNNTNANANYAEFLARKNNMEMQQAQMQQAAMPTRNGATKPNSAPSAPVNVPATGVNNYGASDGVVEDLVAV